MKSPTPAQIAKHGEPGKPIGGKSKLVRAFCKHCATPFRATPDDYMNHPSGLSCEDCRGTREVRDQAAAPRATTAHPTRYTPGKGCWTSHE